VVPPTSLSKINVLAFGRREEVYMRHEDKQKNQVVDGKKFKV